MALDQLPESLDELTEPVYGPYSLARSLLRPGTTALDVGCGNGKVSAYLAASGAIVDGVEPAATRSSEAATRVRTLSTVPIGGSVEDPALLAGYDLITFFDVLEHMAEPERALGWAARHLTEGGAIVASVPNAAHWSFRMKVARGDWTMQDWGLFDRTHLRFFDPDTAAALRPAELSEERREFFTPARGLQQAMLRWRPRLFAMHIVLVWRRP